MHKFYPPKCNLPELRKKNLPTTKEINKPKGRRLCFRTVAMIITLHQVREEVRCGNRNTSSLKIIYLAIFLMERVIVQKHCNSFCAAPRKRDGNSIIGLFNKISQLCRSKVLRVRLSFCSKNVASSQSKLSGIY